MRIISFEGLGGSIGRWVRRGLLDKIRDVRGLNFYEYTWTDSPGYVVNPCIVIGHSFGVRSAVAQAKIAQDCQLLLLLDPRMPPWGGGGVIAPDGIPTACFYQTGFMRGHTVRGADNIHLPRIRHTAVPAHPVVVEYMSEWFE